MAIAVGLLPATAASKPRQIVPLGQDQRYGCLQDSPRGITKKISRGRSVTQRFGPAILALDEKRAEAKRRIAAAQTARGRARLRANLRRLDATRRGVVRCRRRTLPAPARSRRSFEFLCLHGFLLPAAMVDGSCAVNMRPRGAVEGQRRRISPGELQADYDTLDSVLFAECADDGGAFEGPEDMNSAHPLYIVRCREGGRPGELPVTESWDVLAMEVENCDEVLSAEGDCPPPKPSPPGDPSPSPRPAPPSPPPPCVILGMDVENADC